MGRRRDEKAQTYVRRGNKKKLRGLLRRHPELLTSETAGLLFQAMWLAPHMVPWLLEMGMSPNSGYGSYTNTPLIHSAFCGDTKLMKMLLDYGADINATNENSENALGYACGYQNPLAVRMLVEHGADVNCTVDSGPNATQLDMAIATGWHEVAEELKRLGGKRFCDLDVDPSESS